MNKVFVLAFSFTISTAAFAKDAVYECQNATTKQVAIQFDESIISGAHPPKATVIVTIAGKKKVEWETGMFMGLELKSEIYVEFRVPIGVGKVYLDIAKDLKTAGAGILARDEGVDLYDLTCVRK